jgi:mannose-6-phosphate isomerase-like protein (cupin superfamily)
MERRAFVQSAFLGATSVPSIPMAVSRIIESSQVQEQAGFFVDAGADRFGEPYPLTIGHMECKVSARDTAGALAVFEAMTYREDRPVRHLHFEQDEWFYVLEGEYEIHVGEAVLRTSPGGSVFAPRRVPHVWACVSETPGRLMALLQPAGTIEQFFRELPGYIARNASIQELAELNRRHGMETLGPRLPI